MGNVITGIINDITGDSAEEVKEQLHILQEMAHNVLAAESERMAAKAYEDKTLPIVAIVDTKKYTSMDATSGVSSQINDVVGDIFDGKYMEGFKKAISTVLDTFLGNAQAGRSECTEFHVVFDRNALLRIDLFFYKYCFTSKRLKEHGQNLFCYVAQIGVLDSIGVNPQVTLYEVSKSIGDRTAKAKELLEEGSEFTEVFLGKLKALQQSRKELGQSR